MPFLFIGGLIAVLFFVQKSTDKDDSMNRIYDLEDIDPIDQGGGFKRDYDPQFETAADEHSVPFALIKAHAIAESSLNPRAFRDENPTKRIDREGWASRGLCQLLYWPGSARFAQYGYPASSLNNGEALFDPGVNTDIAAQLIKSNLVACNGNLRDAINMYNTGKKESVYKAPMGYVDKVLGYYNKLIKRSV